MICVDTKFFEHIITCMEIQKTIHLQPLKVKIEWQDKINKTVDQCKGLLADVVVEEKAFSKRRSTYMSPEKSIFNGEKVDSFDNDLVK